MSVYKHHTEMAAEILRDGGSGKEQFDFPPERVGNNFFRVRRWMSGAAAEVFTSVDPVLAQQLSGAVEDFNVEKSPFLLQRLLAVKL